MYFIIYRWAKLPSNSPMSVIGKDVIFFGKGCHLVFYDKVKNDTTVYRVNGEETGDGVQCFAGHSLYPVFAFAEIALNPKIFFMKYPEMKILCELKGKTVLK